MKEYLITDYGAVGDGQTMNTAAIQQAIDACGASGGGRVVVPHGQFLSGFLRLRTGVDLHITPSGVLLGSEDPADFPPIETDFWKTELAPRRNSRCFLYAEGCSRIAITGRGEINCQGKKYCKPVENFQGNALWKYTRSKSDSPARMIFFIGCSDVVIEDISMVDPASGWSFWICDCDRVHFDRVKVLSSLHYPNSDGIHINCSRDVTVANCIIKCGDDALIVRAYTGVLQEKKPCERVTVTNCTLTSYCNAIRLGWINDGVIRDCTFSNIVISHSNGGIGVVMPKGVPGKLVHTDDGGDATLIERVSFENIMITNHYNEPVSIKIEEGNLITAIRDLTFSRIHAVSAHPPRFYGRADAHLSNITFNDCTFTLAPVTDHIDDPPGKSCNWGPAGDTLPEYAHIDNLCMNNVVWNR